MAEPLIQFKNIYKHFGNLKVLDGIDLTINKGEITTVIGKSGMGKTVILKHIAGLLLPDSGEIIYQGCDLANLSCRERTNMKSKFGYMFQNVALFDSMTAYDNVALPLREKTNLSESEIKKRVLEHMDQLEVVPIADRYPAEISGGMKKRVGLARVLVMKPEIVLFDEPTTGLDPIRKNAVHTLISQLQKDFNFTGVVVSHEIPDVFYFSHKVAMLDEGKILIEGNAQEVQGSIHPIVRDFIKGVETLKDQLTGLDTKTAILEKFDAEICRNDRYEGIFSIVVFRIDNLNKINETLGYSVGQQLIQNFANLVSRSLRTSDQNSKYRDDIIVSILPGTHVERAWMVSRKVEAVLKHQDLLEIPDLEKVAYSISSSAISTENGDSLDKLVAMAEKKLKPIGYFKTGTELGSTTVTGK